MRTWRLNWQDAKAGDADREVRYGQQGKKHHARRGGNPMASLTARPFGRLREGTRNPESAGFRHRHAGEFQRVNRESQEQEDIQRLRNRGGCAEKRDGTELYGGTARKQAENTLCGHRTELLPLCESGKAQPAHGGTADRQQP